MMGVSLADARSMTWWEYGAMKSEWSDRHDPDGPPVAPPSADLFREQLLRHGQVTH